MGSSETEWRKAKWVLPNKNNKKKKKTNKQTNKSEGGNNSLRFYKETIFFPLMRL